MAQMTDYEKLERLQDINAAFLEVQTQAERIAGHVNALKEAGMDMPGLWQTAATLAEIALEYGQLGGRGDQSTALRNLPV